jgi:hypothetical protein
MTDWGEHYDSIPFMTTMDDTNVMIGHNSAFEAIWPDSAGLLHASILLNGAGNVTRFDNSVPATLPIPKQYTIHFDPPSPSISQITSTDSDSGDLRPRYPPHISRPGHSGPTRPKRYLLRLINTSFESTFVFSIDNHMLQVVESDFVPIKPYMTNSVLVGIGQRYNVIVEAKPLPNGNTPPPTDGNFWIRTFKANCFGFTQGQASAGYEATGILRYTDSTSPDTLPTSSPWSPILLNCSDEPASSLVPILPWTVAKPPVNDPVGGVGENITVQASQQPDIFPLAIFSMGGDAFNPMKIDYGDPTFLRLNYSGAWDPLLVVLPENYADGSWVRDSSPIHHTDFGLLLSGHRADNIDRSISC